MSPPPGERPLWEAASLPSGVAIGRASTVAVVVLVVGAAVGFVGGWRWSASVLLGGAVVLAVLWGSARLLIAGVQRVAPPVALLLAVAIYGVAVVGLFLLAVATRGAGTGAGPLRAYGVSAGALGVLVAWTVALLLVHVRHDRPRGPRTR